MRLNGGVCWMSVHADTNALKTKSLGEDIQNQPGDCAKGWFHWLENDSVKMVLIDAI